MISDEILGGRFKVGERLPTERELAETFGVSRNVIREAIARLTFEGTVEPRQGSGVFVLGTNAISALRLDAEMLRDRSLFASLFELRSILEGEAASLAAARRGRKHLAAIKTALKRLHDSQGTPQSVDADLEFHRAIALASDNVYVAIFINFISEHVRASIAKANERVDLALARADQQRRARGHLRSGGSQGHRGRPRKYAAAHRQGYGAPRPDQRLIPQCRARPRGATPPQRDGSFSASEEKPVADSSARRCLGASCFWLEAGGKGPDDN